MCETGWLMGCDRERLIHHHGAATPLFDRTARRILIEGVQTLLAVLAPCYRCWNRVTRCGASRSNTPRGIRVMITEPVPFRRIVTALALCSLLSSAAPAAERAIKPGESPQAALDAAEPGDKLVFLPGLHEHKLGRHQSILYVDKSISHRAEDGGHAQAGGRMLPARNRRRDHGRPGLPRGQAG